MKIQSFPGCVLKWFLATSQFSDPGLEKQLLGIWRFLIRLSCCQVFGLLFIYLFIIIFSLCEKNGSKTGFF